MLNGSRTISLEQEEYRVDKLQVKKTICMWCHSHCEVNVHVSDGQLVKVVADEKRHSKLLAQTVRSCPRALKAADWFHHPDRLNYPLKRSGERGEGNCPPLPREGWAGGAARAARHPDQGRIRPKRIALTVARLLFPMSIPPAAIPCCRHIQAPGSG